MPYPEDPLPVSVEIYLGESLGWVDITDYVLVRDGGIYIRRGFGDEAIRPEPSSATFTLNNKDGRFSPRNVSGPYHGLIGRNTPVRISVGLFVDQFGTAISDGWGNDWTLVTTGGAASDFDVSSGVGTIVVDGAPEVRAAFVANRSFRDIEVRATVDINDTDISGGAVATGPMLRVTDEDDHYWCAIRVGTDESVTVAIVDRSSGTDTDLDSEATGITWDGTPLRVAFQAYRTTLRAKVWLTGEPEPADWTIEVTDTAHSSGSVGVRVATMSGNTDTPLTFVYDEFEARSYRFHGEISEWPPRWDLSGQDVWVPVTAQGVFRRLQQGNRPARSPFTSAILSANTNRPSVAGTLVAYWPMEDGIDGQAFLPAVPGVEPLRYSGTAPDLAAAGPALGSDRIPVLASDTRLSAAVPAAASGEFLVFCVVDFPPTIGWADGTPLLRVNQAVSSGGVATWEVRYRTLGGGSLELRTLNTSGTVIATATDLAAIADVVQALLILRPNAPILGDALLVIYEDDDGNLNLDFAFGGDLGAPTYVTSIEIAPTGGLADLGVGQVGVSSDADFLTAIGFTDTGTGLLAFDGETAADRAARLAGDAGVSFTLIGDASDTEPLGRQAIPAKLMDALDETWRADMALLFESRHELGLTFRTRASLYNQDAGLTLAYTARGEIAPDLEPVDDDQKVRNDITVKRKDGSSTRAVDTTSRLSVKPPPDGVGTYDEQVEINLHGDHQLPNQASWRLHLGTWDEARFPRVVVDFAALMAAGKPGLVADACALDVGDRATLTDLPVYSGALDGMADLMALGMAEQIGHPVEWRMVVNYAPYGPWRVGVYADEDDDADDDPDRYDTAGCETLEGLWCPGTSGAYASTPDDSSLDITGDIDIRVSVTPSDWTPSGRQVLASKWIQGTNQGSWFLSLESTGRLKFRVSPDGTNDSSEDYDSTANPAPPLSGRLSVRVTLDVNNGSGQSVATFYTSEDQDLSTASWTQLGSTATAGVISIFNSSTAVAVGASEGGAANLFAGVVHRLQARSGIGGTVVADVNFDAQDTGDVSIVDDAGLTWTVHGDAAIYHDFEAGTDTKLLVVTTLGPAWTTDPNDLPMRLRCAGVVLTVSEVEGSGQPQVLTISAADAEKTITPGTSISLARPSVYAL